MSKEWLSVSLEGLRAQAEEIGRARVITELVSNAWDEDGTTAVTVVWSKKRGGEDQYNLIVSDNAPKGFRYLEDAYTLFAPSYKRDNPEKRGRFNLGEKWFLALCDKVKIESITGTVSFSSTGRAVKRHTKTLLEGLSEVLDGTAPEQQEAAAVDRGTKITAVIKLSKEEIEALSAALHRLIVPEGIMLTVNGEPVRSPEPVRIVKMYLPTLFAEKAGQPLRHTTRTCDVQIYESWGGDEAWIYEMGIPVSPWPCRWSVNVQQKVPLNHDRDSVTASYQQTLLAEVANNMVDALTPTDASGWATEISGSYQTNDDTVRKLTTLRFGEQAAIYDPSDKEANARWAAKGGTVVHGGTLNASQWDRIKQTGALQPAGKLTPTPLNLTPQLIQIVEPEIVTQDEWSDGMKRTAQIATKFAKICGIETLAVRFVRRLPNNEPVVATYSCQSATAGHMMFVGTTRWYDITAETYDIIIHELAHHFVRSHHDQEGGKYFYDAVSLVAGKICKWSLDEGASFLYTDVQTF